MDEICNLSIIDHGLICHPTLLLQKLLDYFSYYLLQRCHSLLAIYICSSINQSFGRLVFMHLMQEIDSTLNEFKDIKFKKFLCLIIFLCKILCGYRNSPGKLVKCYRVPMKI